jgi:hypothetical protein
MSSSFCSFLSQACPYLQSHAHIYLAADINDLLEYSRLNHDTQKRRKMQLNGNAGHAGNWKHRLGV